MIAYLVRLYRRIASLFSSSDIDDNTKTLKAIERSKDRIGANSARIARASAISTKIKGIVG